VKNARIVFMVFGIAFLMFVITSIASAQNIPSFLVWNGTVFKMVTNVKGYYYSPTNVANLNEYDHKINDHEIRWGIVTGDEDGNFQIAIYSRGQNRECVPEPVLPLQYVAGTQLVFVANFVIDDVDTYSSGLVYIKAQLDNTGNAIKPGGTLTTISAYIIEQGFDVPLDLAANELTLKGNVVKNLGCTLVPE